MEELGAEFWPSCRPSSTPPNPWEEGRAVWELGVQGKSGRRLLALGLERRRAGVRGFLNPPHFVPSLSGAGGAGWEVPVSTWEGPWGNEAGERNQPSA